ncbi:M15 family metallopeptidase [Bordetella hinzii]|uniref:M15 family metallopeptidase n=1 Tax=Bordetella hinzii TaxID=103855 RepID=UPI003F1C08B0
MNEEQIASALGISYSTLRRHKASNEQFQAALKKGKALGISGVTSALYAAAVGGKGASQTQNSFHLKQADGWGHAVDLAPLVGGAIPWSDWAAFRGLADTMKACAAELRVPLEWGGDWRTPKDGPHFQIPRDWKGRA